MDEPEWLNSTDPQRMLEFLRGRASDRKLRLFACACCRRIWHLLEDERSRRAVEVAERYADGLATIDDLASCEAAAERARSQAEGQEDRSAARIHVLDLPGFTRVAATTAAAYSARADTGFDGEAAWWAHSDAASAAAGAVMDARFRATGDYRTTTRGFGLLRREEWSAQGDLLRDLFGLCPFRRRPPLGSEIIRWNGDTISKMANVLYEARRLPSGHLDPARLAVLADALEEAGCQEEQILGHLRGPGLHVRGCWALDATLEKG